MAASFPIGEFLVRKELLSPRALAQVLKEQEVKRQRLISMLILRAELEIDDAATVLSEQSGYPAAFERHLERRDTSLAKAISGALCAQYAVIPVGKTAGGRLVVAARDPSPALTTALEEATQRTIELAIIPAILVERLVRATFGLAIDPATTFPTTQANMPRARSVSVLYADSQPERTPAVLVPAPSSGPTAIPAVMGTPRQPTAKIVIPERKSGPVQALSDLDSAPILLDRPKQKTGPQPATSATEKTLPRFPIVRSPAIPQPTEDEQELELTRPRRPATAPGSEAIGLATGAPEEPSEPSEREERTQIASLKTSPGTPPPRPPARPPTQPPPPPQAKPQARPPTQPPQPPPPRPQARPPTQPPAPPIARADSEATRPARPIAADTGASPRLVTEPGTIGAPKFAAPPATSRNLSPTTPAPNVPVPADARPPDRRQQVTVQAPNTPIPDAARRAPSEPSPPGSIALAELAVEAGATASDPAVAIPPHAVHPTKRARSVSESFGDLLDEPAMVAAAPPLPAPSSRPAAPPERPSTVRAATEPTALGMPPRPPPPPGTGSVDAVGKEIERAISRATADRVLITFASSRFKSALLVMIADGVARGARGQGPRLTTVQTIVVPIEAPSIIQVAHDTRALTRESPASPTQERLGELLGTSSPLAVPVVVDDGVVAVLAVGDPTTTAVPDEDLEKVVAAFATAYKRLYKPK